MTEPLRRELTVPFSLVDAGRSVPLAIQGDPGFYSGTDIHLLLTPNVNATVRANVGTVTLGANKVIDVPGGVLQTSGSDSVTLPFVPDGSNPEFEVLFAFDDKGVPITVGVLGYDALNFVVRLQKKCTAAIAYKPFKTTARKLTYTPQIDNFVGGGVTVTYGVIAAFYPPSSMVVHQVEPPALETGNAEIELYRIVSSKVITTEGEFETPPGYPGAGTYPGKTLVLDVATSVKVERVHEIGFIDALGRAWVRTPSVLVLEPYVGDGSYTIAKTCRIATLDAAAYPKEIIGKASDFVKSKGLGCKP